MAGTNSVFRQRSGDDNVLRDSLRKEDSNGSIEGTAYSNSNPDSPEQQDDQCTEPINEIIIDRKSSSEKKDDSNNKRASSRKRLNGRDKSPEKQKHSVPSSEMGDASRQRGGSRGGSLYVRDEQGHRVENPLRAELVSSLKSNPTRTISPIKQKVKEESRQKEDSRHSRDQKIASRRRNDVGNDEFDEEIPSQEKSIQRTQRIKEESKHSSDQKIVTKHRISSTSEVEDEGGSDRLWAASPHKEASSHKTGGSFSKPEDASGRLAEPKSRDAEGENRLNESSGRRQTSPLRQGPVRNVADDPQLATSRKRSSPLRPAKVRSFVRGSQLEEGGGSTLKQSLQHQPEEVFWRRWVAPPKKAATRNVTSDRQEEASLPRRGLPPKQLSLRNVVDGPGSESISPLKVATPRSSGGDPQQLDAAGRRWGSRMATGRNSKSNETVDFSSSGPSPKQAPSVPVKERRWGSPSKATHPGPSLPHAVGRKGQGDKHLGNSAHQQTQRPTQETLESLGAFDLDNTIDSYELLEAGVSISAAGDNSNEYYQFTLMPVDEGTPKPDSTVSPTEDSVSSSDDSSDETSVSSEVTDSPTGAVESFSGSRRSTGESSVLQKSNAQATEMVAKTEIALNTPPGGSSEEGKKADDNTERHSKSRSAGASMHIASLKSRSEANRNKALEKENGTDPRSFSPRRTAADQSSGNLTSYDGVDRRTWSPSRLVRTNSTGFLSSKFGISLSSPSDNKAPSNSSEKAHQSSYSNHQSAVFDAFTKEPKRYVRRSHSSDPRTAARRDTTQLQHADLTFASNSIPATDVAIPPPNTNNHEAAAKENIVFSKEVASLKASGTASNMMTASLLRRKRSTRIPQNEV